VESEALMNTGLNIAIAMICIMAIVLPIVILKVGGVI
jgi:hypothetical protein